MNTPSFKAREEGSMALLNYGFSFYETKALFTKGQSLKSTVVRKGVENAINAVPAEDIVMTIPRGRAGDVHAEVSLPAVLIAPLAHGSAIGKLTLTLDGKQLGAYDVYPAHDVAQAGIIGRTIDSIRLLFSH
jgi:D-alanyl-D-alanine carboxypeptidase (penicillin-binding protein 5/6)